MRLAVLGKQTSVHLVWGAGKRGELKLPKYRICDNLDMVYVLSKKFTLSLSVNFQGLIGEINNFF